MTGTIRDTDGGIVEEESTAGTQARFRAGRRVIRIGVFVSVLLLAGSLFVGVAVAADPIEISNWTELQGMEDGLDGEYVLVADLDESTEDYGDVVGEGDGFDPIGENGDEFIGTFDGNDRTISDLTIMRGDEDDIGLFGVTDSATIKNVGLVDVDITGETRVGGLVGDNTGGTIFESYATGSVESTGIVAYVGGLVGSNTGGTIEQSHATVSFDAPGIYVGGLVGRNTNNGNILMSYATGDVKSESSPVGGLVGQNNDGTIEESYATGSVESTSATGFVGGLVGDNTGGTISESYATGSVDGSGSDVGGLVGRHTNSGNILMSYATGDVKSESGRVGGLVGASNDGTISESYATGSVESTSAAAGGLVGSNVNAAIEQSHATGSVDGPGRVGGLVGSHSSGGTITESYATGSIVGSSSSVGGLVGLNQNTGEITASYATGSVESTSSSVGGFAGQNSGTISDSNATGSVDGSGNSVGGLVGLNSGTISDSNATGSVDGSRFVGGLVGVNDGGEITESYATGSVDGTNTDRVGGLVGWNRVGATIADSYATGSVDGSDRVGGLVGRHDGTITASYASGSVDGTENVGGLVGENNGGAIEESYATGSVDGSETSVGGLVGQNTFNSEITESYASGAVNSPLGNSVGGLVGTNGGEVTTSYATGSATGSVSVGGLIGRNTGTVEQSYASGSVEGSSSLGGLIGTNTTDGEVTDSYWDIETTGQTESAADATGLTTAQMTGDRAEDNMFDFGDTWQIEGDNPENGLTAFYPVLQNNTQDPAPSTSLFEAGDGEAAPYQVSTWYQLDAVRVSLDSEFVLTSDLDEDTSGYEQIAGPEANNNAGFDPIGDFFDRFSGHFDGSEHTISNLTIMRGGENYVGLFGYVGTDGELTRVSLEAVDIEGDERVGGLAGETSGTIEESYVTGSVKAAFSVGGLVGVNMGDITKSHATAPVNSSGGGAFGGLAYAGGLVGWNNDGGTVTESYATGSVDASGDYEFVGGLVGYNSEGVITKSYATGSVESPGNNVGGLAGSNEGAIIEESYATGSVESSGNNVGGLVGAGFDDTTTNSYWDLNTTGQTESANGTGLTTEQMTGFLPETTMEPLTSSGFSITDGYPLLDWSIDDLTLTLAATDLTEGSTTDATVSLSVVDDRVFWANETADYTTGDTGIATVDNGTVSAEGGGSTTISASVAAASDEVSLSVTSAPRSTRSRQRPTEVTVSESTDDDSGASDPNEPDARISVTNPVPGQRLVIEGNRAFIAGDDDESGSTDSSDSETDDGASNVRSDRLSIDINTDRDFELSVTTYETDLTRSIRRPTAQTAQSVDPVFASGASVLAAASTTPEIVAPEAVSAAAAAFENETQSVSAGYLNVEHTLEPEEITGATFEFSIRQPYLDELGVDADGVILYHQVDGEWEPRETDQTDADDTHYRFEGSMESFSVFALGTEAAPIGVTEASLSDESVETGETTTVSATVENRGQHRAEHTLELTADGEIVATEIVSLDGGEIAETTLSFEPPEGEYAIAVSGTEAGILTVGDGELTQSWLWLLIGLVVLIMAVLWRRSQQANNEKSNQQ